ncbi:MAG: hypothetical protein AAB740_02550 [Patescibacteria group bacterium]
MLNKKTKYILSALAVMVAVFGYAHLSSAEVLPEPVSLNVSPLSPSPGENVSVIASTPTLDKDTAVFTWIVDGKTRSDLSGQGKDSFVYTAGGVGSISRILVKISSPAITTSEAEATVYVEDLALTWQANTYVPKWYKGKALPVPGSIISFVALPRFILGGAGLRPESLIYRWTLDGEQKLAGLGKNVFRVQTSELPNSAYRVGVVVEDSSKVIHKEEETIVTLVLPELVVYPATPLGGAEIRQAASDLLATARGLLDLVAEPFFFSVSSKNDLGFNWTIADNPVQGQPRNPYLLTVDTGSQPTGSIPISVTSRDLVNLEMYAVKNFNLTVR